MKLILVIFVCLLFIECSGKITRHCICNNLFFPQRSITEINYIYFDNERCITSCHENYSFSIFEHITKKKITDALIISIGGYLFGWSLYFINKKLFSLLNRKKLRKL
jgi:hypothetical protein